MGRLIRPCLLCMAFLSYAIMFSLWRHRSMQGTKRVDPQQGLAANPPLDNGVEFDIANKFSSADDFKAHFRAVLGMPGIAMAEAKSTCIWAPGVKVNFQYDTNNDWVTVDRLDQELDARRQDWHDFVKSGMIPYAQVKNRFNGRGIVIVAGNRDTLMRVKVILRALVRLGSSISVEINYWDDEINMSTGQDLLDIYPNIYFNDLSKDHNILRVKKDGFFGVNYQLKTAALLNSRFAEPLLLDSDNIPVVDPITLYEAEEYKEYGTIFWPDIARTRPNNPAWAITNTRCRMDEYEQESGQLLVDKRRFFYHLQLAAWFNNEQGAYYNEFLLGDKDMFRFAWHALKTRYGRPKRWLTSLGTLNDDYYCGHSFAQHHPDANGKIAFVHGGLTKTTDPQVLRWQRDRQGGYYRNYKASPLNEDSRHNVDVGIKIDAAEYMHDKPDGIRAALCTDMFDVKAGNIDEILPGFEQIFDELGGYWILENTEDEISVQARAQDDVMIP